jgi:halimadienyl-diphosphate synthase
VLKESTIGPPVRVVPDRHNAVRALWRTVYNQPWGQMSPSIYETGRLVALAPWLRGHADRLRFLVRTARGGGEWGRPGPYGLVPTLSAVDAALAAILRGDTVPPGLPAALDRGLAYLAGALGGPQPLPDTPAIEVIVPNLVSSVNAHLRRLDGIGPLPVPPGLPDVAAALRSRPTLPVKALHSLEALDAPPDLVRGLVPTPPGSVGASPAATAAWLAAREPDRHAGGAGQGGPVGDAVLFLEALSDLYQGPVPSVVPIGTFEIAWVGAWLLEAGVAVPSHFRTILSGSLGPAGTSGGPGLPPDADTTSVVLAVLSRLGHEPDLDCLLAYDGGGHFRTWAGERTASVTTNAHVLDVLGARLMRRPGLAPRYGAARRRVVAWLVGQQRADGSWTDKWHASPFYATASCTLALSRFGGAGARPAVARAVRWLVETQYPDGSWGLWRPTAEETAYAVHALAGRRHAVRDRSVARAVNCGRAWLLWRTGGGPDRTGPDDDEPALWHDKDLYRPAAIVRAAVLSALLATRRTNIRSGGVPAPPLLSTVECPHRVIPR